MPEVGFGRGRVLLVVADEPPDYSLTMTDPRERERERERGRERDGEGERDGETVAFGSRYLV